MVVVGRTRVYKRIYSRRLGRVSTLLCSLLPRSREQTNYKNVRRTHYTMGE